MPNVGKILHDHPFTKAEHRAEKLLLVQVDDKAVQWKATILFYRAL